MNRILYFIYTEQDLTILRSEHIGNTHKYIYAHTYEHMAAAPYPPHIEVQVRSSVIYILMGYI